ncbi:hypothetical protein, partial [Streptomyces sp. NPDC052127]|uniref:hypothetical protein n=1 Tax=Streptomyces sp. NPDC052127 TaxID=3155679 RepID=UPI0034232CE6
MQQHLSGAGQGDAAAVAGQQADAEAPLELLDRRCGVALPQLRMNADDFTSPVHTLGRSSRLHRLR